MVSYKIEREGLGLFQIITGIYYCPEIKSHTNPIISLIMCCIFQKLVNFVGKLRMTLIESDFDTCG